MNAVLYVSDSLLEAPQISASLRLIQNVSLSRNKDLGLTGVLIATPRHFVQFLEGGTSALEAVMNSIKADGRHHNVTIADMPRPDGRLFPRWGMACFGESNFVRRYLDPLLVRQPEPLTPVASLVVVSLMGKLVDGLDRRQPVF